MELPDINFYKSNGVYLFEVFNLHSIECKDNKPRDMQRHRACWSNEVVTFALINDELISIDKRLIDERKERYDICANENFMTLDCYLSDKHKRSDRPIKPIPIPKPITKPIPKEIKPLPEGFNTQCEVSKISIYGHWDSAEYSKGYKVGRKDGVRACELYQEK